MHKWPDSFEFARSLLCNHGKDQLINCYEERTEGRESVKRLLSSKKRNG